MVLVMVMHTLVEVTATVPMAMILLKDFMIKKQIPNGFKLRMVIPTSGTKSMSLWDVADSTQLIQWMTDHLGEGISHEVYEVVEDFTFGTSSALVQARAAEKVQEKTKQAVHAATSRMEKIDTKFNISEKTEKTLEVAKQRSSAVIQKVATSASKAKHIAMENPTMASAATAMNQGLQAGWKSMEKGLDWAVHKIAKPSSEQSPQNTPQSAPSSAGGPQSSPTKARESERQTIGNPGSLQDKNTATDQAAEPQISSGNKGITDTKLPQSNIPVEGGDAVFSLDDELEENEQPKPQA